MGLPRLASIKHALNDSEIDLGDVQQLMVSQTLLSGEKSTFEKVLGLCTVSSAAIKLGKSAFALKESYSKHANQVQLFTVFMEIDEYDKDILQETLANFIGKYAIDKTETYDFKVVDGETIPVVPSSAKITYEGATVYISEKTSENARTNTEIITGYIFRCEELVPLHNTVGAVDKAYHKTFDNHTGSANPPVYGWDKDVRDTSYQGRLKGDKNKSLFLREGQKEQIYTFLDDFADSEERYYDLGVPYKTGILLYGPPGTGKTSTLRAIAQYTKKPILYISLGSIENDDGLVKACGHGVNSIIVFEDIDILSAARSGSTDQDSSGVTRQGLLNVIDGINSPDDAIFIVTTNRRDELDEALTRSGRIDLELELDYMDQYQLDSMLDFLKVEGKIVLPEGVQITGSDVMGVARNFIRDTSSAGPAIQKLISGKEKWQNEVKQLGNTV